MSKPTKEEVAAEIAAMKALVPVGLFAAKTARTIELQIEELEHGVDDTAEEWDELGDELQMAVLDARGWASGDAPERPSQGWGGLVK